MSESGLPERASPWQALRQRKLVQWALAYAAVAFALVQGIDLVAQQFGLGDTVRRAATILLATGLPISIVLAWFHGERGAQRVSGTELTWISVVLALGVALAWRYAPVAPREMAAPTPSGADARVPAATPAGDGAVSVPDPKSIAVLPFADMSQAKDQEYFSDGISEELLNLLAKIPQLRVTARTSSFSFKGKDVAIPEIAKALHVAHVLEGSVRKAGNTVRITVQLVKADSGTHLWSETYDRKLDDVFAIQDEIAADVVKQLKVTLLGAAPKARATDPEAYAMYLQAAQFGRQFSASGFEQSDALLHRVLAIDPRYAPAWSSLSLNYTIEVSLGLLPAKDGYVKAREAARNALEIDPDHAPAHARLGWIAMSGDNDLAAAALHFSRAMELDPNDADVLLTCAMFLPSLGRVEQALAFDAALIRRDPLNATRLVVQGQHLRLAGRLDEAMASYRAALSIAPGWGSAHAQLGTVLLLKGDAEGALAEIEQEPIALWKQLTLPMAYHALGRHAESDAALAALVGSQEKDWSYNIAYNHAFRGDADQAFAWLDKAVAYSDTGLSGIVTERLFDSVRADPRWLPFLRRIGKAPEQLAGIEFKVELPEAGKP